jgi:hypothetical protein
MQTRRRRREFRAEYRNLVTLLCSDPAVVLDARWAELGAFFSDIQLWLQGGVSRGHYLSRPSH